MLTPRQLVYLAALLKELQRRNCEQWPLPPDPALEFPHAHFSRDSTPAPAHQPAPCPPSIRTAVPADLTRAQLLDLHAAIATATRPGPRVRMFDQDWRCVYDSSRAHTLDRIQWPRQAGNTDRQSRLSFIAADGAIQ